MKSFTEYLWFKTAQKQEFINITPQAEAALAKSGIKEGLCLVNPMHITASVLHTIRTQCKRVPELGFRIKRLLALK
jgi:thiamine phosphate synthase YjbQ (UPF0047 family)